MTMRVKKQIDVDERMVIAECGLSDKRFCKAG